MSVERPFTVSSFYKFVAEKKLMAAQCDECESLLLPPKPMCTKCFSTNLKWIELENIGNLISYTVIHVAPKEFQSIVPYFVGIIKFKNGLRLPGIIRDISAEEIKVGIKLKIHFETSTSNTWPEWNRYFFKPV